MLSSCPVLLWWCRYMQHACYKGQNRLVFTGCSIIEPPGRCPVIDHQKMPFDRRQKCSFPAEPDMLLLPETFRRVFQKAVQKKKGEQRSRRIAEIKRMILSNYARQTVQENLLILTCGKVQLYLAKIRVSAGNTYHTIHDWQNTRNLLI